MDACSTGLLGWTFGTHDGVLVGDRSADLIGKEAFARGALFGSGVGNGGTVGNDVDPRKSFTLNFEL